MNRLKNHIVLGTLLLLLMCSIGCTNELIKTNINPNDADPDRTNPNLVLSTVLTQAGQTYVNLGFGDLMGVMQYTKKDGWGSSYNNYQWQDSYGWSGYYGILRNNKFVMEKAVAADDQLLEGVTKVMRAMIFGTITNMYGDIPYVNALNGDGDKEEDAFPPYSKQEDVFKGILQDLEEANALLSLPKSEYSNDISSVDVFFKGDPVKWRKLANSLALRYYWRLSEKAPDMAKTGFEKITNNPTEYPLILNSSDDATMSFPGHSAADSWPNAVAFDADSSGYRRVKMDSMFVGTLLSLNDPRIGVWAQKVKVFLHVDNSLSGVDKIRDTVVNGEARRYRLLSPDRVSSNINQNTQYVGIPMSAAGIPQVYNMSPEVGIQAPHNPHVSWLAEMYMQSSGPLLLSRIMSASEVHFILAEAKLTKGWGSADAETEYYNAIKASFETWNTSGNNLNAQYGNYIAQPSVAYAGTQEQILVQKWISNWSAAHQSWFDFRRTGYPKLHGVQNVTQAPELPIRMYYPEDARLLDEKNTTAAEQNLQTTIYSGFGNYTPQNSLWSRMWLLQTGNDNIPWNR